MQKHEGGGHANFCHRTWVLKKPGRGWHRIQQATDFDSVWTIVSCQTIGHRTLEVVTGHRIIPIRVWTDHAKTFCRFGQGPRDVHTVFWGRCVTCSRYHFYSWQGLGCARPPLTAELDGAVSKFLLRGIPIVGGQVHTLVSERARWCESIPRYH